MTKKAKVVLCLLMILICSISLFFFVLFKAIPNPLINNKDLKCSRIGVSDNEVFLFEFDWIGKVTMAQKIDYVYFETEKEAQEYYDYYVQEGFKNIKIEKNTVIFSTNVLGKEINAGTTRKALLEEHNKLGFECK